MTNQQEISQWLEKQEKWADEIVEGIVVQLPPPMHDKEYQNRINCMTALMHSLGAKMQQNNRCWNIVGPVGLKWLLQELFSHVKCPIVDERLVGNYTERHLSLLIRKNWTRQHRLGADSGCKCIDDRTCDQCYHTSDAGGVYTG